MISISDLLVEKSVLVGLEAKDKTAAIKKVTALLELDEFQIESVCEAVLNREAIISTGVGQGLAIPHCKVACLDKHYAAFALLKQPVLFDAVDNEPVSMIFLLAGPSDGGKEHLTLLSRISRLMNNRIFRNKLRKLREPQEIIDIFKEEENTIYSTGLKKYE